MFKKFLILGLVLLFAGAPLLGWVVREQEKQKRLEQELDERLKADLQKLDNVAGDRIDTNKFKGLTYEQGNSQKERFRQLEEKRGLFLIMGSVLALTGSTLLFSCMLLTLVRLAVRVLRLSGRPKNTQQAKDEQSIDNDPQESQQEQHAEEHEKPVGMFANFATNKRSQKPIGSQMVEKKEKVGISVSHDKDQPGKSSKPLKVANDSMKSSQTASVADRDYPTYQKRFNVTPEDVQHESARSTGTAVLQMETPDDEHKPLAESMSELTQQMSAIRDYASHQQERVRKLQDGYDWGIVKNFCLRIIRCIDNLDNRIASLTDCNGEATHLQEVKDELIFALESTGVEQFEPEINSEYRGQEKNAEAVKDKQQPGDSNLTGKIARVIRPGYRYFIDDDNFKVVRTAQVKLFA